MLSKPRNSALQSSKKALQGSHNRGRVGGGAGRRGRGRKGRKRRVSLFIKPIKPKQLGFCIFNILKLYVIIWRGKEDSGDKNR